MNRIINFILIWLIVYTAVMATIIYFKMPKVNIDVECDMQKVSSAA